MYSGPRAKAWGSSWTSQCPSVPPLLCRWDLWPLPRKHSISTLLQVNPKHSSQYPLLTHLDHCNTSLTGCHLPLYPLPLKIRSLHSYQVDVFSQWKTSHLIWLLWHLQYNSSSLHQAYKILLDLVPTTLSLAAIQPDRFPLFLWHSSSHQCSGLCLAVPSSRPPLASGLGSFLWFLLSPSITFSTLCTLPITDPSPE